MIALVVILLWAFHLFFCLSWVRLPFQAESVQTSLINLLISILHVIIQTFLFTGLFITAHDSMHGSICDHRGLNKTIGFFCTSFYAAMDYRVLRKKHQLHHQYPATENDPDFSHKRNFWSWWFRFMKNYLTLWQLLIMALLYNLFALWFPQPSILLFWVLPAILSTLQLFYFGTYRPHRLPHTEEMTEHRARSQRRNHLLAMLSCYFFGYHLEHHLSPRTPWWQLYKMKTL